MADTTERAGIFGRDFDESLHVNGANGTALDTRHHASASQLQRLQRTIEDEIIPRLVLAHRHRRAPLPDRAGSVPLREDDVAEFTRLIKAGDYEAAQGCVRRMQDDGVALEEIYLNCFAECARRLGEMWKRDEVDFTTVTLCLWQLRRLLSDCSAAFQADAGPAVEAGTALLAPMPGEQHTFGLLMVADFFRKAQWEVVDGPMATAEALLAVVHQRRFDIVGFSIAAEMHLPALPPLIRQVRSKSLNRSVRIMAGGPAFVDQPEAALRMGADASATDGREAVISAAELLRVLRREAAA